MKTEEIKKNDKIDRDWKMLCSFEREFCLDFIYLMNIIYYLSKMRPNKVYRFSHQSQSILQKRIKIVLFVLFVFKNESRIFFFCFFVVEPSSTKTPNVKNLYLISNDIDTPDMDNGDSQ